MKFKQQINEQHEFLKCERSKETLNVTTCKIIFCYSTREKKIPMMRESNVYQKVILFMTTFYNHIGSVIQDRQFPKFSKHVAWSPFDDRGNRTLLLTVKIYFYKFDTVAC